MLNSFKEFSMRTVRIVFRRFVSGLLVFSMAALPFTAQAGLIGTDEIAAQSEVQSDRDKVREFVARADVQQQLQEQGVTPQAAKERVDALSDAEVQQIAGKIDTLPAGATSGTAGVIGVTLLVVLVTYMIVRLFYPQR
jgi:hypothetical protein